MSVRFLFRLTETFLLLRSTVILVSPVKSTVSPLPIVAVAASPLADNFQLY